MKQVIIAKSNIVVLVIFVVIAVLSLWDLFNSVSVGLENLGVGMILVPSGSIGMIIFIIYRIKKNQLWQKRNQ